MLYQTYDLRQKFTEDDAGKIFRITEQESVETNRGMNPMRLFKVEEGDISQWDMEEVKAIIVKWNKETKPVEEEELPF
jgi:hypothetical protein